MGEFANNETMKVISNFGCGAYQKKYGKNLCNIDNALIE